MWTVNTTVVTYPSGTCFFRNDSGNSMFVIYSYSKFLPVINCVLNASTIVTNLVFRTCLKNWPKMFSVWSIEFCFPLGSYLAIFLVQSCLLYCEQFKILWCIQIANEWNTPDAMGNVESTFTIHVNRFIHQHCVSVIKAVFWYLIKHWVSLDERKNALYSCKSVTVNTLLTRSHIGNFLMEFISEGLF